MDRTFEATKAKGITLEPMNVKVEPITKYFWSASPGFPSVPTYLMNYAVGRSPTPASRFYQDLDRAAVLSMGIAKVQSWPDIPMIQDYCMSKVAKYGAQGGIWPLSAPENVDLFTKYYRDAYRPCRIPESVMRHMKRKLGVADLRPLSYQEVIARAKSKGRGRTQAGVDTFLSKNRVEERSVAQAEAGGLGERDAVVEGQRAIRNGHRFIFMSSAASTYRSLRWIHPIEDWLRDHLDYFKAWIGQDAVEQHVTRWSSRFGTFLSGDYSKMDTCCGVAQYLAFYEITKWMWPRNLWPEYRSDLLHDLNIPTIRACVRYPGAPPTKTSPGTSSHYKLVVVHGTHSNESGLAWNQTLETVLSMTVYVEMMLKGLIDDFQLIGDDSIGFKEGADLTKTLPTAFNEISAKRGLDANPEKQFVSLEEFKYLQRVYNPETVVGGKWRGAYPLILALNSAKNPERDSITGRPDEKRRFSIKLISIVENMVGHPKFHEAIDLFVGGDPNRLGLDDPDLWYDDALYQSMRDHGDLSWSVASGGGPSKLRDFATVKYLIRRGANGS